MPWFIVLWTFRWALLLHVLGSRHHWLPLFGASPHDRQGDCAV